MRVMILDGHPYKDVEGSSIPTNKELYGAKKRKQGFLIKGKYLIKAGANKNQIDPQFTYFFPKKFIKVVGPRKPPQAIDKESEDV